MTAGFKLAPVCFAHMGIAIKIPVKKWRSIPVYSLEQVEA